MSTNDKLLIIGAGGHGHVVAEVAQVCGYQCAFLDDHSPDAIGTIAQLEQLVQKFDTCFVAIGNNVIRKQLMKRLQALSCTLATLVHPTAYVSPSAKIGLGTIVAPNALINTRSLIGGGCILSAGCIVDHDVVIQDYVHINAGAICKAGTTILEGQKIDAGQVAS